MRFTPKTESELQSMNLIPQGIYDFCVIKAEEQKSKSGNDMIVLTLKVWEDNRERQITDYLLEAMPHKFRHFNEAVGLLNIYQTGELHANDCLNKKGKVEIIVQQGQAKPDGSRYPNKNSIKDYVVEKQKTISISPTKEEAKEEIFNDDIPF